MSEKLNIQPNNPKTRRDLFMLVAKMIGGNPPTDYRLPDGEIEFKLVSSERPSVDVLFNGEIIYR